MMDLNRETQLRKEFRNILVELAQSQEKLQDACYRSDMYKRLEALYDTPSSDKEFRHFYSDIFSVLVQIKQNPETLGDINILGQNLAVIRKGYQPKNTSKDGRTIDVSDAIRKLYDHVSLDIARMSYSDAGERKISSVEAIHNIQTQVNAVSTSIHDMQTQVDTTSGGIRDVQTKLNTASENIQDVQTKLNTASENIQNMSKIQKEAEEKINNQQKEYITILGIFASIVLAFTGGIAFSTSVLNNIAQASIYRTVLITLIIGLVLINVLFGLFFYINKMVNKNQKIIPLVISNLIFVLLIILTIIAWYFGWVENRDNHISKSLQQQTESMFSTAVAPS